MSATPTPPDIQVYASFPHAIAFGTDLNVDPDNWHWVHSLSFPLPTLDRLQFSHKPYKWIRYSIGIIVGAEGDLSFSPDFRDIADYNSGPPYEPTVLYYHINDDEKRKIFPVDPNITRTRVTSSVATSRRAEFCSEVAERDGNRCVFTEMDADSCNAVHLIAHSKGDTYISTYTQYRSRCLTGDDIIQEIDSVRNGLFLNNLTHGGLGQNIAFLPTPNFAMVTTDIDYNADPEEKRYTAHLFKPSAPSLLGGFNPPPSGSPLRRISNSPEWPPTILFDAVYAGAVLHHFGTQELKDVVSANWNDVFYPDGVMDQPHADYKKITYSRAEDNRKKGKQAQERMMRYDAHHGPDAFDTLMTLPYIMVPQNELKTMLREAKEKAEATEQKRVQEKVNAWNRQVISS
ncbi:hypothetical protein CPB84DRAFT_1733273 [Gymnopilus junonius]|uniref:HNH nuclease domain-containing protein n=1 Tax=Gymnopilus junonius TaxID=109634 RepID=A0A9P5TJG6_GYMJU|nr:hypothetical protein CPB84DRAFT_1733273 [Gymnopilus junonius]